MATIFKRQLFRINWKKTPYCLSNRKGCGPFKTCSSTTESLLLGIQANLYITINTDGNTDMKMVVTASASSTNKLLQPCWLQIIQSYSPGGAHMYPSSTRLLCLSPKQHLDRFSRFCLAYTWPTHINTCKKSPHLVLLAAPYVGYVKNVTFLPKPMPSVLWRCWLGSRKGIWPVKKLSGWVLAWLSQARCICIWSSWCHCHSLSLASVKSRLVLPFWYRLTQVVPDKGPLNGCCCCSSQAMRLIGQRWSPFL